jgi:predicted porin
MKKSLVLAAVAATLAAPAFAQSSVTIYGRLNLSVEHQKTGDVSNNAVVDNASRIGFKGTEDIGGGTKALFVFEHGFDADTGKAHSTTFWNRESTVGLESRFGTVRLGYMAASEAYFATADYISNHNHDTGTSEDELWAYIVTGGLKNAVAYSTPNIGGAVGHIQIGEGVLAANGKLERPTSGAVNFDKGPLHIGFGYEALGDVHASTIRGLYELGAFTVGAYYGQETGGVGFTRKYARGSAMYALGAGEFHVNVGKTGETKGVADSGATQWTLGYNHNLSKRTKVYTFYTKINNDNGAAYGGHGPAGADFSSLAVGIRHNF